MSSSGDPLQGGPTEGLWQGVQNEQKIVKNEMLVQCNEWEAKWMIWLKYMYERIMKFCSEVVKKKMNSSGDPLQGGPTEGLSLAGSPKNEQKKIVKNEMLVQCNEWEAKWMIWLK